MAFATASRNGRVQKALPAQDVITQHLATIAYQEKVIAGQTKICATLRRWKYIATWATTTAVLAIGILALVVWFHPALRANGTTKTASTTVAKNTAKQETVVAATTKSVFVSADKKVRLEIKIRGTCLEVVGHIFNDDEFAVIGVDSESQKSFRIGEELLNKRTLSAGMWNPQSTPGSGTVVQIRRIGSEEPLCEKTIVY